MGNLILFGLFIILLLAVQFTSAKTVDEIIEKHSRARGGSHKLSMLNSIFMEGTRVANGMEASIKIIQQQDKLCRSEMETGTGNFFLLITEQGGWVYLQPDFGVEKISPEKFTSLQTEMDIAGPLIDHLAKGHTTELLGKELVEGNSCYKIKLITRSGNEMKFWIDTSTYLVTQSSGFCITDNKVIVPALKIYRNYKMIDGIQFAHTCETRPAGSDSSIPIEQIVFHQIRINTAVDSRMFQPTINYNN